VSEISCTVVLTLEADQVVVTRGEPGERFYLNRARRSRDHRAGTRRR